MNRWMALVALLILMCSGTWSTPVSSETPAWDWEDSPYDIDPYELLPERDITIEDIEVDPTPPADADTEPSEDASLDPEEAPESEMEIDQTCGCVLVS